MSRRLLLPLLLLAALASMGVGEGVGQWRPPQYTTDPGSMVNVRDFGAVGDGVTDDTAEIQAALNSFGTPSCNDGDNGVVYVPSGVYIVSTALNVPRCVLMKGAHRNSTTLRAAASFGASEAVITLCQEDVTQFGQGCALDAISIDANNVADWGVMTTNAQEGAWIRNFVVRQVDRYGIYLKSPAGADPGVHRFTIDDGEVYFGPGDAASGDRGIHVESNPYGPMDLTIRDVTVNAGPTGSIAGTIAADFPQSGVLIENFHTERFETGLSINAERITVIGMHCTSSVTTCILLGTNTNGKVEIISSRADAGVTANIVDNEYSRTLTDVTVPVYLQTAQMGGQFTAAIGATTTVVCAAATGGSIYYDTNVGGLGTADDGALCQCSDKATGAVGYRWRMVGDKTAGIPNDPAGNSTTDCGT